MRFSIMNGKFIKINSDFIKMKGGFIKMNSEFVKINGNSMNNCEGTMRRLAKKARYPPDFPLGQYSCFISMWIASR